MVEYSISRVIPPLQDLKTNLNNGFYDELRFSSLEDDANVTATAASDALALCSVNAEDDCSSDVKVNTATSDNAPYKATIEAALSNSLSRINVVLTDKYFGTDDMQATAVRITYITENISSLDTNASCTETSVGYCSIYSNAYFIVSETEIVTEQIDKYVNSEIVNTWEDNKDLLTYLYALPLVLILSALFFFLFWWKDAACVCSKGGSKIGCCFLLLHSFFCFAFFIIATIVCSVGWVVQYESDEITTDNTFKGDPSLKELLDHVETTYPTLWNSVMGDLEPALKLFLASMTLM